MNSKNILLFLVLLLIYINVFVPLSDKNRELTKKIQSTEKSIQKDKLYILNEKSIKLDLNNSSIINSKYTKEYMFKAKSSKIFNLIQKDIKKLMSKNEVKEDSIKWGESYKDNSLTPFPLSVRVSGSVKKIGNFFKDVQKNKKIHIKSFILRRTKQFYILELSLYGLKRD